MDLFRLLPDDMGHWVPSGSECPAIQQPTNSKALANAAAAGTSRDQHRTNRGQQAPTGTNSSQGSSNHHMPYPETLGILKMNSIGTNKDMLLIFEIYVLDLTWIPSLLWQSMESVDPSIDTWSCSDICFRIGGDPLTNSRYCTSS